MGSVGDDDVIVAHRWTRAETLVLAHAMRAREEEAHDVTGKSAVGTASEKWEVIAKFCRSHGVHRSNAQCSSRWANLYHDYRRVRDWRKEDGVESYWKMNEKRRREKKLPAALDEEAYKALVSFLDPDLKQTGTPESEVDSDRPSHVSTAAAPDSAELRRVPADAAPVLESGSAGDTQGDKQPARKRKRVTIAGAIDNETTQIGDTIRDSPRPAIDVTRPHTNTSRSSNERPTVSTERGSWPEWEVQHSTSMLDTRTPIQKEAEPVRMLKEQVAQIVEASNQRLQAQLQGLFSQLGMQLQVAGAQMQAQMHEAARGVQSELHSLLQVHSDQVHTQVQPHSSLPVPHRTGPPLDRDRSAPNCSNMVANRSVRPTLVDGPAGMLKHLTSNQPQQVSAERERRQIRMVEGLPAHKARPLPPQPPQPPHSISEIDRLLRQQQAMPGTQPSWNQAHFVISELDRVLGHQRPAEFLVQPPPAKCTYVVNETDRSMRQQHLAATVTSADVQSQRSSGKSPGSSAEQWPLHSGGSGSQNVEKDGDVSSRQGQLDNPLVRRPCSSDQVGEPSHIHPTSSDTVDAEDTQGSGQEVTASPQKTSSSQGDGDNRPRAMDNLPRV